MVYRRATVAIAESTRSRPTRRVLCVVSALGSPPSAHSAPSSGLGTSVAGESRCVSGTTLRQPTAVKVRGLSHRSAATASVDGLGHGRLKPPP